VVATVAAAVEAVEAAVAEAAVAAAAEAGEGINRYYFIQGITRRVIFTVSQSGSANSRYAI
jgi:hypothetical protein